MFDTSDATTSVDDVESRYDSKTSDFSSFNSQPQFSIENQTGANLILSWPTNLNFEVIINDSMSDNSSQIILQKDLKCLFLLPLNQLLEMNKSSNFLSIITESSNQKPLFIDPIRPNKYGSDFQNIHAKVTNKHMNTKVVLRSNLSIKNSISGTLVVANLEIKEGEEAYLPLNMIEAAVESQEKLSCMIQQKFYPNSDQHTTTGIFNFSIRETYEQRNNQGWYESSLLENQHPKSENLGCTHSKNVTNPEG